MTLASRALTRPVQLLTGAVSRIAGGDLTVRPASLSRDELGWLAADFRRMAQGLGSLVVDVQAASRGVEDVTRAVGAIGGRVRASAAEEQDGLRVLQGSLETMQGSVAQVARGVGGLGDNVHATTAALGDLASALALVRRQAGDLEGRSAETGADVHRLAETGRRAQALLAALAGQVDGVRVTLGRGHRLAVGPGDLGHRRPAGGGPGGRDRRARRSGGAGGGGRHREGALGRVRRQAAGHPARPALRRHRPHPRLRGRGGGAHQPPLAQRLHHRHPGRRARQALRGGGRPDPRAGGADLLLHQVDRRHHPGRARRRGGHGPAHRPGRRPGRRRRGGRAEVGQRAAGDALRHLAHPRERRRHPRRGAGARALHPRGEHAGDAGLGGHPRPGGGHAAHREGRVGAGRRLPRHGGPRRRRGPGAGGAGRPRPAPAGEPHLHRRAPVGDRSRGGAPRRGHPRGARGPRPAAAHRLPARLHRDRAGRGGRQAGGALAGAGPAAGTRFKVEG